MTHCHIMSHDERFVKGGCSSSQYEGAQTHVTLNISFCCMLPWHEEGQCIISEQCDHPREKSIDGCLKTTKTAASSHFLQSSHVYDSVLTHLVNIFCTGCVRQTEPGCSWIEPAAHVSKNDSVINVLYWGVGHTQPGAELILALCSVMGPSGAWETI